MKIENKDQLKELMTKHIFDLTEEEIKALAFVVNINITSFKKSDWNARFTMSSHGYYAALEVGKGTDISMGRTKRPVKGFSGLVSWGGCFSFASAVQVFRQHYMKNQYNVVLKSEKILQHYEEKQFAELVFESENLVEAA